MSSELANLYNDTRAARKVIVVALGFLGDSIHLIPALWEIKRNYPEAELHVATTPLGGEVLRLLPCVDRIWPVARNPRQSNWRQDWRTVRALRRERFDLAINFSGADRPTHLDGIDRGATSVAHTGPRKHFWSNWLIPHWVPRQPPGMPVAEQHLQRAGGVWLESGPAPVGFHPARDGETQGGITRAEWRDSSLRLGEPSPEGMAAGKLDCVGETIARIQSTNAAARHRQPATSRTGAVAIPRPGRWRTSG